MHIWPHLIRSFSIRVCLVKNRTFTTTGFCCSYLPIATAVSSFLGWNLQKQVSSVTQTQTCRTSCKLGGILIRFGEVIICNTIWLLSLVLMTIHLFVTTDQVISYIKGIYLG